MPLPLIAAAVGAVGSGISGAIQASRGRKQAREAQREIDAFQRQDLTNFADQLQVRTEAQDFQAEQSDQSLANVLDTLQQGGSFESATSLANQSLKAKQNIAATIQQQRNKIDLVRQQENSAIRGIQENRDNANLAGLGAKLQFGNQQRAQGQAAIGGAFGTLLKAGISGLGGATGAAGAAGGGLAGGADVANTVNTPATAVNQIQSISSDAVNNATNITTSGGTIAPNYLKTLTPSVEVGQGSFGGIFNQGNFVDITNS